MPVTRTIVVTFEDGSTHTYNGVPNDITRDQVMARAAQEFSAKRIANVVRQPLMVNAEVPTQQRPATPEEEAQLLAPEPTLGDRALGAVEAAGTLATGATTGLASGLGHVSMEVARRLMDGSFGTREAAQAIEQAMQEGLQAGTYAPRTPAGRDAVQAVGGVAQQFLPIAPLAPQLAALSEAARAAAPAVAGTAQAGAAAAGQLATKTAQAARDVARKLPSLGRSAEGVPPAQPGAAAGGSAGAAGVDLAALRQGMANELPVPIQLTRAQRNRTFADQQREQILAKDATIGEPIRQRYADQRQQLVQNMDSFLDATDAQLTDLRSVGEAVDKSLRASAAKEKQRIRVLYKEAEKAGELEAPVALDSLAQFYNENGAEAQVANVIGATRQKAINLGMLVEGPDGKLVAQPVPLRTGELFRRSVNNLTNAEPTNIKFARDIKELYDAGTESAGGEMYAAARAARRQYAERFELNDLTRNLLGAKRGTADRAIAYEDVLRRVVFSPSTSKDSLRHVGVLLKREGSQGQQAWRELQGATIRQLQERALSNVARDERGTPIFSAAKFDAELKALDRSGKLDYLFGKRGANQLRVLNDVAKDVLNPLPGAVNTSNTATTLAAMMDLFAASATGVPLPVMTSFKLIHSRIRDAKLRARVKEHLAAGTYAP